MEPEVKASIEFGRQALKRMLTTLAAVPDDKLTWRPAPTSRSALEIAAHAGLAYGHFAQMMRGDKMPSMPPEEMQAHIAAAERAIASRDEVVRVLEDGFGQVAAVLESLTPEQTAGTADTPFGPLPMSFMLTLVGRHADNHAAQIDYLQTLWGDEVFHM